MIEEDYDAERAKVMSAPVGSLDHRVGRLHKLADARRKEIKGVLTEDQFEDWQKIVNENGRR